MKNNVSQQILIFFFAIFALIFFISDVSHAQTNDVPAADPNSTGFKLLICDGPELPITSISAREAWERRNPGKTYNKDYSVCNFNGAMRQVQYLINVMLVVGILAAIVGFSYAGYLFITGVPDKRNQAKDIFAKAIWGLVIMICAWFMVYQLIKWMVPANSGVDYLISGQVNK